MSGCYPFFEEDPFVLKSDACPHVLVCPNQKEYASQVIEDAKHQPVRVILLPDFKDKNQIVLLNLKDMTSEVVSISVFN